VVAEPAIRRGVRRLVFAHIGRPTIAARDTGQAPPYGEFGADGAVYTLSPVTGHQRGATVMEYLGLDLPTQKISAFLW
jgi:hypothetical protein